MTQDAEQVFQHMQDNEWLMQLVIDKSADVFSEHGNATPDEIKAFYIDTLTNRPTSVEAKNILGVLALAYVQTASL